MPIPAPTWSGDVVKPASFDYHRAETLAHALALLRRHGTDAKLLAGGQSLAPMLNLRLARPGHLIDINDLVELDSVRHLAGRVEIGGLTRHHRLATDPEIRGACPILSAAAATIGHYAIRQRGTIGGSLSHADPAAQLPLVATLLDAEIRLASQVAGRSVRARDFFVSSLVTALEPDEMITSVRFPVTDSSSGWGFELFSLRHGDFAVVSVACVMTLSSNGTVEALALALGGVAATPVAMDATVLPFLGRQPDLAWRSQIGAAVAERTAPEDDPRIPTQYRKDLAASLTRRALAAAAERARKACAHD
jgi:carbon-monoxide dehydrogenase medium subunit